MTFTRRDLFKSGLAFTGGLLLPSFRVAERDYIPGGAPRSSPSRRKLGGTLEVSGIGLGCQEMAGSLYGVSVKVPRFAPEALKANLARTGNTRAIAEMIQKNAGGTVVALELVTPYPADYHTTVQQVIKENEAGDLPPLKTKIDSMESYDMVFVGFPTWDMQMPPPMKSFLKQYDLSGKTVVPFNTNAGYGVGSGFQTVKELCPNSRVVDGFSIRGGIERDGVLFVMRGKKAVEAETAVKKWLRAIIRPSGNNSSAHFLSF